MFRRWSALRRSSPDRRSSSPSVAYEPRTTAVIAGDDSGINNYCSVGDKEFLADLQKAADWLLARKV